MLGQEVVLQSPYSTEEYPPHTRPLKRIDEEGQNLDLSRTEHSTFKDEIAAEKQSILSAVDKKRSAQKDEALRTSIILFFLVVAIGGTGILSYLLILELDAGSVNQSISPIDYSASALKSSALGQDILPVPQVPQVISKDPTLVGDPLYPVQPIAGPSIVFPDGKKDYLYAPSNTANAVQAIGTGDFTMSVRFKGEEDYLQSQHPVFLSNRQFNQKSDSFLFGLHAQRGAPHKIACISINGTNWMDYPDQPYVLDGTWHHFVARRKGKTLAYFVDGMPVAAMIEDMIAGPIGLNEGYQPLVIGYDLANPGGTRFQGEMEELSVWDMAKGLDEIALGLQDLEGDEDGLIAYFPSVPLDEVGEINDYVEPIDPLSPQTSRSKNTAGDSDPWP